MGVFPEGTVIGCSGLIRLWVAEGFLKPVNGKILEEIAEECLKDLIDRNLILVHKWRINGKIKSCKIHDLLRDLCLREAEKEKFLYVRKEHSLNIPQGGINTHRRIAIHRSTRLDEEHLSLDEDAMQSATRSLIYNFPGILPSLNFRLLRILRPLDGGEYSREAIFQLVNSRHLEIIDGPHPYSTFLSTVCLLWNLHTLIGNMGNIIAPVEIWKMPQLRHVKFGGICLPNPPSGQTNGGDDYVLENLQTLLYASNLKFSEEVVKKIPSITKLRIVYDQFDQEGLGSHYCLNNLGRLHKLESLYCYFSMEAKVHLRNDLSQNLTFPHSLKKLTLVGSQLHWEDMATKIGSLPLLQVLSVLLDTFIGSKWETIEGQFPNLKFLVIEICYDLEYWITDSTHFPCLERLVLRGLGNLKEIPWDIGELPTLQSIELEYCSDSAVISAKKLQEELGDVDWEVRVHTDSSQKELMESLASDNFLVTWLG